MAKGELITNKTGQAFAYRVRGKLSPERSARLRKAWAAYVVAHKLNSSPKCTVIFYEKAGKFTVAQRCLGRKLAAHNKQQCRRADAGDQSNKRHLFIDCDRVASAQSRIRAASSAARKKSKKGSKKG